MSASVLSPSTRIVLSRSSNTVIKIFTLFERERDRVTRRYEQVLSEDDMKALLISDPGRASWYAINQLRRLKILFSSSPSASSKVLPHVGHVLFITTPCSKMVDSEIKRTPPPFINSNRTYRFLDEIRYIQFCISYIGIF